MEYCEYDYDSDLFYDAFSLNYPVSATSICSVSSDQSLYLSEPDFDDPDSVSDTLSNHRPFLLSDRYDWFEGNDDYPNSNDGGSFVCNWNDFGDDIRCDIDDGVLSAADGSRLRNSGARNGVGYGRIDRSGVPSRLNPTTFVDEISGRRGTRLDSVIQDDLSSSRVNNVNVDRPNFRVLDDVMYSGRDNSNAPRSGLGVAGNVTDLNGVRLTSSVLNAGRLDHVEGNRMDFRVLDDENELYVVGDAGGARYGFDQRAGLGEFSGGGGLRVVGIDDSESEFEEEDFEESQRGEQVSDSLNMNSFFLEEGRNLDLELDWEEVDEMERERMNAVINGVGELSLSSEFSSHEYTDEGVEYDDDLEDVVRNIEWDFLLNVGDLERNHNFGGGIGDADSYLDIADVGTIYAAEYHAPSDQFMENGNTVRPGPPAAKMVMQNLPEVELRKEDVVKKDVACAVCKEGISDEEKVKKLPCSHYYHGDCIVPWLNIRNTCPVCRYELPTDDLDYERRKNHSAAFG